MDLILPGLVEFIKGCEFFIAFAFYFLPNGDCGVVFICHLLNWMVIQDSSLWPYHGAILRLIREYNFQINSSCKIMVNSPKTSLIVGP